MNISKALLNSRLMKSLTGLSPIEFNELEKLFSKEILIAKNRKKDRIRAIGGGRRGILLDSAHKLFYILFYFKVYPTFDMASFVFNTSRSKTCEWVKKYQPLLEQCLKKAMVLPKRKISTPEELYQLIPGIKDLLIDGVERKALRAKKAQNSC